jgi:hypothetical protein
MKPKDGSNLPAAGRKRYRGLTVRFMIAMIAIIALGLGAYRHAQPWLRVRRVHPDLAPVAALFKPSLMRLSCAGCHSEPASQFQSATLALIEKSPHGPGRMLDCKSCHAR